MQIATLQIQQFLYISVPDVKQVWLADEATGAGSLKSFENWWTNTISKGAPFGYYVNEKKSWLIIKGEAQRRI